MYLYLALEIDGKVFIYVLTKCLQDLKSEKQKAQMGSARAILEKSTMMLLTSCKVKLYFSLINFMKKKVML